MESIKTIVKGTKAILSHVCNGTAYYIIETEKHKYQLAINSSLEELSATYLFPEFKAITLMRWIRKGIENESFIQLS